MREALRRLLNRVAAEEGQTLSEYALIIAFVVVATVAALAALAVAALALYGDIVVGFP